MNLSMFDSKNTGAQKVDRFVFPRETVKEKRRISHGSGKSEEVLIFDVWDPKHRHKKNYVNHINAQFGLKSLDKRKKGEGHPTWPCHPRKKGYLTSSDSILDLPTYSNAPFPDLLDWSENNMLVAALGYNYHMYSWDSQTTRSQGLSVFSIQSCRFNPTDGDTLLIGTSNCTVEVHNTEMIKIVSGVKCICASHKVRCSISSIDWSRTGNTFATGCSRGWVIASDTRVFGTRRWHHVSENPVLCVRISPDSRYIAVASFDVSDVQILLWPSLQLHAYLDSGSTVTGIAWHPWCSSLLAMAVTSIAQCTSIGLWDIPASRFRDDTVFIHYSLDGMLFSHITGELVLSLWNPDSELFTPQTCSQLVVMSDSDTVVDQSGEGKNALDRIRTMVFSPDGTKLATATTDEDLVIWNFLPEDKKKKKKDRLCKKWFSLPMYLDILDQGSFFR